MIAFYKNSDIQKWFEAKNMPKSNSTQNDWEVRFNDRFLDNWGTLLDIKHFIRKELADARREVIDRVESEDVVNRAWIKIDGNEFILVGKEFLATLREEES